MTEMGTTKAIMTVFNTDGYNNLSARELRDFKNADPEGYEELGRLANKILQD